MIIDVAIGLVIVTAGSCGAGVATAWLNDRRVEAKKRRKLKPEAKAILGQRLASGEITEEEYNRKMHLLVYGPPLELH